MINHIGDDQLRHRVYQASFKGVQRAIEEKAREHGVPVIYVDPRNTSRVCPIRNAPIAYRNGGRVSRCSKGGELWHRDVVACYNLLLRARLGDGGTAPSPGGLNLGGSPVPLGSTAAHDPMLIAREAWARWKSLDAINKHGLVRMGI
jgi:transposase